MKKALFSILILSFLVPAGAQEAPETPDKSENTTGISVDYGLEYFSLEQLGFLGNINTELFIYNLWGFSFFSDLKNFGLEARFESKKFQMENQGQQSDSLNLVSFFFGAHWKILGLRAEFNQEPLLSFDTSNEARMANQNTVWLLIGLTSNTEIKINAVTYLRYSLFAGIPLKTESENNDVNLDLNSGYKINLEGSFYRAFAQWENSKLMACLSLGIYYQNEKFNAEWVDLVSGAVEKKIFKTNLFGSLVFAF